MKNYLFQKTGNFYKADLHIHSNVSDGKYSPEELKKLYMEKGYSIIAFTDHEIMLPHPELTDENFLALTSTELSVTEDFTGKNFSYPKTYHLNFYCPEEKREYISLFNEKDIIHNSARAYVTDEMRKAKYLRYHTVESVNDMIAKANAEGFLVTYNHPFWSLHTREDYIDLKGLWGVEVYNHGSYVLGYVETATPADEILRQGEKVVLSCTDDAHDLVHMFGGWVVVNAKSLSYDDVFTALKNKDMYSSTGPAIEEIFIEDGYLHVKSSPAKQIFLTAERRFARNKNAENGTTITDAKFEINSYIENSLKYGTDPAKAYLRVTVYDENGRFAYSRPYFLDEILELIK